MLVFVVSLIHALIHTAYPLMCYICGQNDLQPPGECHAQFQYECSPYASKFGPTEQISCRTTKHRVGNGTYNVLKECIAMSEHLEMFPNGKMQGCTSLFDETGFEVSYCICQWNFCNEKPLHLQIQKLEEIQRNESLALDKSTISIREDFPLPPDFDDKLVVPHFVTTSNGNLKSGHGRENGWSPFQNPPKTSWDLSKNGYAQSYPSEIDINQNSPPPGAAFIVDGRGPVSLQQSFAKEPYDPESTGWIQQNPTPTGTALNLLQQSAHDWWQPASDANVPKVHEKNAGNSLNSPETPQEEAVVKLQMSNREHTDKSLAHQSVLDMSTLVTSGSLELLPAIDLSAWQPEVIEAGKTKPSSSIPLTSVPLLCNACSESDLQGHQPECSNQTSSDCALLYPQGSVVFCFTRDTALNNGLHTIEKTCISEEIILQEYGDQVTLPGCGSAWNGQVNFCVCPTSNCNEMSLALQWLTFSPENQLVSDDKIEDQMVHIQPVQPQPHLVMENEKESKVNISMQKCYVCGESDLNYPSDCTHQYEYNCSKQYPNTINVLCLTRQTKLASGLYSMEKRCISGDEHREQYPGAHVVMDGCGEAWNAYVQYCVCQGDYCNKMALSDQRINNGIYPSTPAPPSIPSNYTDPMRQRLKIHPETPSSTSPLITSLDLNQPTSTINDWNKVGRPDQLPPDFKKLLSNSTNRGRINKEWNNHRERYTTRADSNYYDSVYERHLKKSGILLKAKTVLNIVPFLLIIISMY